ncbi:hypothetical protein ASD50_04020 [Mesorhizobium sp. Root552]|nr:hypothetical protein ASD50_04020 [Mesorhizobium sp. Root552]
MGSRVAKAVFFGLFAFVAGASQFLEFWPNKPSGWQISGIVASALVFVGALYAAIADENAPQELETSRRAIETATEAEYQAREALAEIETFQAEARRAVNLYLSVYAMRGALERFPSWKEKSDAAVAKALVEAAGEFMHIAAGFEIWHRWTFGIYRARLKGDRTGKRELICVAKRRAIECDISQARIWDEGTGILGVAFTNRQEVIIGDTSDTSVRAVFAMGSQAKPEDGERYKSFAAVPILVGSDDTPWGVVIATNDQDGHFVPNGRTGVQNAEIVRAFAGMVALGVGMCQLSNNEETSL